jgi:hypothetical protein
VSVIGVACSVTGAPPTPPWGVAVVDDGVPLDELALFCTEPAVTGAEAEEEAVPLELVFDG